MANLVEFSAGRPLHHPLGNVTTLGRSTDNAICLQDGAVSAHHAVIRQMPNGRYQLEDLETTNGTFVGGAPVRRRILSEGDKITLGGVSLCFTERVAEGTPAPELHTETTQDSLVGRLKLSQAHPGVTQLHRVKMTLSQEMSAVRPTWEMPASHESEAAAPAGDIEQEYQRLKAGYDLIHAIVGEDDLDAILDRIVNSVIDLMAAERAAVLLVNAEGQLEPKVAMQKERSHEEFQVSSSILSYVTTQGKAVVCEDLGQDSRFSSSKSIIMNRVRSAMCVPMLHEGELVGVLHMDTQITRGTFSQDSLEIVTAIANTAAYAVKTAMLKEQLRAMERQQAEAMRAMISGASHFINNPLAVIQANLSMFEEWSRTLTQFHASAGSEPARFSELFSSMGVDFIDEELEPMAQETNKSAARIGEIVRALHMFEQESDPSSWTTFDMAELVGEVMHDAQAKIAAVAQAHTQLAPAKVCGVRKRLAQLLRNLVTNAWQAIETSDAAGNWVVASCHVDRGRVQVTIDDTGRGIPSENRHRVFAPFDTDRLDGSMGLGLAVAAEIARQHNARLSIRDRQGGGTRLLLEIPLATAADTGA